jgi:tetratricopeptide (TPR) repeat protein
MADNVDDAIKDMDTAVSLNPGKASYWWELAALRSYKLANYKEIPDLQKEQLLRDISAGYRKAIELNPTDQVPWLDCIEMNLVSSRYDEAISLYGECKPYVNSKEYILIRAWLGCLAMVFAGDEINEEDYEPLTDSSIVLEKTHWRVAEVNRFLNEIRENQTLQER